MNPLLQCKPTILPLLIAGVLACFGLLPKAEAVVPPPDGGYPGFNTAEGQNALFSLTTGVGDTAVGWFSLFRNTDGSFNTGLGAGTLLSNTSGTGNTAVGTAALANNTTGSGNIAIGVGAGENLTTGDNNIQIGDVGVDDGVGESNRTRIRNISFMLLDNGNFVTAGPDGLLGVGPLASSRRYNDEIKPMDKTSEVLFALKPVTFRHKQELHPDGTRQYGLISEEVEKVNPDLVFYDEEGKASHVRHNAINAMLLNEFLKEHRKVQELEANDAEQQRAIKALVATVKEQAAQLQKVSGQIELSKATSQTVANNR
jgi:Chaperone of endosialidase